VTYCRAARTKMTDRVGRSHCPQSDASYTSFNLGFSPGGFEDLEDANYPINSRQPPGSQVTGLSVQQLCLSGASLSIRGGGRDEVGESRSLGSWGFWCLAERG